MINSIFVCLEKSLSLHILKDRLPGIVLGSVFFFFFFLSVF